MLALAGNLAFEKGCRCFGRWNINYSLASIRLAAPRSGSRRPVPIRQTMLSRSILTVMGRKRSSSGEGKKHCDPAKIALALMDVILFRSGGGPIPSRDRDFGQGRRISWGKRRSKGRKETLPDGFDHRFSGAPRASLPKIRRWEREVGPPPSVAIAPDESSHGSPAR